MNKRRKIVVQIALFVPILFFLLLLAQFFRLQVVEHKRWKQRAERQHYFVVKEAFRRGRLYAHSQLNGKRVAFAIDVPLYHLYADPKAIPDDLKSIVHENIVRLLSPLLKEAQKIGGELGRRSRSRRLVSWISEEQKQSFMTWWKPFSREHSLPSNAIFFVLDFRRFHPMGHVLGQVLHTIQERRDERTGRAFPTGGLELSLNEYLEGEAGYRRLMRSPHNSLETGEVLKSPINGSDVELTIDHNLQAIVEEELEKGVKQYRAKVGMAVLVEPKTGHILAMAQYPFFYPDKYQEYFNDPLLQERAKITTLTDAREPGSPTKALTVALALKANRLAPIFSVREKIATHSGSFPGRSKPLKDARVHRFLNFYMAVQKSSNIYMAILAQRMVRTLGDEWYVRQLRETFGLGRQTGVELVGESFGLLPHPKQPNTGWSKAAPYSLAIGYNFQATSLQMARAFCVLANGGKLPELTLIRKIFRENEGGCEETIIDNTLETRLERFPQVLDHQDVSEVNRALRFVTKKGGTGTRADVYGYTEAGKSGTSMKLVHGEYSSKSHFASFCGFAPATDPAFVLYVGFDQPKPEFVPGRGFNHKGGMCAAPVFRSIARRALQFLGVPEDDPYGFPDNDPRADPEKAVWNEEAEVLCQLYTQWNER